MKLRWYIFVWFVILLPIGAILLIFCHYIRYYIYCISIITALEDVLEFSVDAKVFRKTIINREESFFFCFAPVISIIRFNYILEIASFLATSDRCYFTIRKYFIDRCAVARAHIIRCYIYQLQRNICYTEYFGKI